MFKKLQHLNIYDNIFNVTTTKQAVVTIGTFDGVHKGHRNILEKVVRIATDRGLTSIVLTFFPHPRMVLQPETQLKLINSIDERMDLLEETGVENAVIHPFSEEFSRTSALDYVKTILVDQLKARVVVIGYDHRFGRNRSASIQELKEYGQEYDFEVIEISKQEVEDVAVSSTKVRNAIIEGDMVTATSYLSKPFVVKGTIVTGKKLGRTLGYPTANLQVQEDYKLIPKTGVYVTSSLIAGNLYYGMTNVGVNPTVDASGMQTIETYYFNLDKDLYGTHMQLHFHKRLRGEQKFDTIKQLVNAMDRDAINAKKHINNLG